jgi:hypothetical protein
MFNAVITTTSSIISIAVPVRNELCKVRVILLRRESEDLLKEGRERRREARRLSRVILIRELRFADKRDYFIELYR